MRDVSGLPREAIEALPAAVYMTDAEGRITFYNEAAAALWGCRPEIGDAKFCGSWKLYRPDGTPLPHDKCAMAMALQQKRPIRGVEAVAERPDGTRIPFISYPTPLFDASGRLTGAVNMLVDISERRRAEEALAESEERRRLAGKACLVGTFAYDTDMEIMQISEGYVAVHGFPEGTAEIARSKYLAGVHPEDIERVQQRCDEAFCKGSREYSVEHRIIRPDGEVRWVETRCFISYCNEGRPRRVIGVCIDLTERKRAEERQRGLIAELDHRVKNVLANVSAVVAHTRQGSTSVTDFAAALDGRIASMATTHELLSAAQWEGISLRELIRRELAPYATRKNTEINGPEVVLRAEAGQAMAMVFHELATNATKYGALSTSNGRISIRWDRLSSGHAHPQLVLEWREIGGPTVVAPGKPSYGTSTIRDLIPYELGGTVDLVLAPDGVRCRVEIPADWLGGSKGPSLEYREHIKRDLRNLESEIAIGERRLFKQGKLIAKLKDRRDLIIAQELKLNLETGLNLMRLQREHLLKELEPN